MTRTKQDTQCPILLQATYITAMQEGMDLFGDPNHAVNVGVQRYYRLPCPVKTP